MSARLWLFAVRSRESPCLPQLVCQFWSAEVAGERCVRDAVVEGERAHAFAGCPAAN